MLRCTQGHINFSQVITSMSLCLSVGQFVGRSVVQSVCRSVHQSGEILKSFLGFGNAYDQIMILRKPYLFLFLFKCEKWPYKAFDSFKGYVHLGGQIVSLQGGGAEFLASLASATAIKVFGYIRCVCVCVLGGGGVGNDGLMTKLRIRKKAVLP